MSDMSKGCDKCRMPEGVSIKPDGVHELDPCIYRTKQIHRNATVIVSQCEKCGHIDISWKRQDDTESEYVEEFKEN